MAAALTQAKKTTVSERDDSLFFSIDDRRYVAWSSTAEVSTEWKHDDYLLANVIPKGSVKSYSAETLSGLINTWSAKDDVFTTDFLQAIIFEDQEATKAVQEAKAAELLKKWQTVHIDHATTSQESLKGGPHILRGNKLYQVRRLFDDTNITLVCSLRQRSDNIELLNDGAHGPSRSSVAVPSRFAVSPSQTPDLTAVRVVIKDIIDIKGLPTSNCNWAYMKLHAKAPSTAPLVQQLVDFGAAILGKTKLSPFLTREEASEAVDFQTTWNPRADGYQSPGGSSSGSAAAAAAYEWLDVAVGSDTNGSVRRPSQCCGVFGLRPSRGAFSNDGVFTVFNYFDVPGFFARDLQKLNLFAGHLYPKHFESSTKLPIAIIAPNDFWPDETSKEQKSHIEAVIMDLEKHFNLRAERINIEEAWNTDPPEQARGEKLHDYLAKCGASTFLYSNYWNSGKLFLEKFKTAYGDEKPYVSPFARWRWEQGIRITKAEHEEGMHRLDVYAQWIRNKIMKVDERFPLLVTPSETVRPLYREDPPPQYYVQPAWNQWWISSITGSPELCLPVGTVPYESKVSDRMEELPCSVDIMGKPGSDLALVNCVQEFMIAIGRTTRVQSGRHVFSSLAK